MKYRSAQPGVYRNQNVKDDHTKSQLDPLYVRSYLGGIHLLVGLDNAKQQVQQTAAAASVNMVHPS